MAGTKARSLLRIGSNEQVAFARLVTYARAIVLRRR
jgi:hypothetical protein